MASEVGAESRGEEVPLNGFNSRKTPDDTRSQFDEGDDHAHTLCTDTLHGSGCRGGSPHRVGARRADDETGTSRLARAKTITGELLRVEYGDYFVKGQDGKEVRLTTDKTTQMMGQLKKGDRIEAKVNEQNHALLIRQAE